MKKVFLTALIIFLGIIFLIVGYFTMPWISMGMYISQSPDPPSAEITYGEFPFKLVYEINGEEIVVEDTVICEYNGIGMNEGMGKFRKWKSHLANTGEENVLLVIDGVRKVYCYVGDAEYYMGDEKWSGRRPLTPHVYDVRVNRNVGIIYYSQDELLDKYKIKLISWEFSDPIVNSFN